MSVWLLNLHFFSISDKVRLSLVCLSFSFLLSFNLGFDSLPVELNFAVKLLESRDGFLLVILLKETLAVCNDCVNVRLLIDSNFKSSFPLVHLNIQFNCSVEKTGSQKNLLCFRHLFAVYGKSCVSCWLTCCEINYTFFSHSSIFVLNSSFFSYDNSSL